MKIAGLRLGNTFRRLGLLAAIGVLWQSNGSHAQSGISGPSGPEVSVITDGNGQIFVEWEGAPGCRDTPGISGDLATWTPVQTTYSLGERYRVQLGQIDPAAPLPPGATRCHRLERVDIPLLPLQPSIGLRTGGRALCPCHMAGRGNQ